MLYTLLLIAARVTGILFIFSGVAKHMSRRTFLTSLQALPFLPSRSETLIVAVLPWIEIVFGSLLIVGLLSAYVAAASLLLLAIFSAVAVMAVTRGLTVPCSCFGTVSRAPLSWRTVARNCCFALMLLPTVILNRPSPLSADAMLSGSATRSVSDAALLASFPLCVAGLAVLISTAQRTLAGISAQ